MRKDELVKIMNTLSAAYGDKFLITNDRMLLFWDYFKEYDPREVWWGMKDYISKNRFPPTICDLLESVEPYKGRAKGKTK